jgi:beta-lactamase family protein
MDQQPDVGQKFGFSMADVGTQCRLHRCRLPSPAIGFLSTGGFLMRTPFFALCLELALFVPVGAVAEPIPSVDPDRVGLATALLAGVDALMQSYVSEGKLAGVLMLIARDGKVAHAGVYGQMDIEGGQLMRRDALFRIYSMTKPIVQRQGVAEIENPLEMLHVARDEHKVVLKGDCGNHRVGPADELSRAFKVAVDTASKLCRLTIEWKNLFGRQCGNQDLDPVRALCFLQAFDDLHHSDCRQGIVPKMLTIGGGIVGHDLIVAL